MKLLWRFALLILLAVLGVHAGTAFAQSYPSRPIRVVVPYPAGGGLDIVARLISPKMADALKQPILVENRPGANGQIGQNAVAKAAPDGHTILIDTVTLAIGPAVYRNLPFDAAKDFIPVTRLVSTTLVLGVSPKLAVNSIRELIALAKSKPGSLNYAASSGVGSSLHLAMALLKVSTGMDIQAIPYKGDAPATHALMTGEVDLAFVSLAPVQHAIKEGRLRALGVSSARRLATLPDVPTIAEGGVTDFEYSGWQGLYVPAKTPRDVVEVIQREAVKSLNVPEVRDRILALGLELVGGTQEEAEARYRADLAKFARIVKEARIPMQN